MQVRDVMTKEPIVLDADATAADAARAMRARDIGDVLVRKDGKLFGIVTDRDLVVRCVAETSGDRKTKLGELCSGGLATLAPDAEIEEAARLMQDKAVRRIPIVEDGRPVGIVTLGDLALAADRRSALAQISAAPPSR
jgi:CBS domain-containing protein